MVFCISSSVVYFLNVTFSRLIAPVGDICYRLLVFVVPGSKEFLFLWVLGKGCIILLWYSRTMVSLHHANTSVQ